MNYYQRKLAEERRINDLLMRALQLSRDAIVELRKVIEKQSRADG